MSSNIAIILHFYYKANLKNITILYFCTVINDHFTNTFEYNLNNIK